MSAWPPASTCWSSASIQIPTLFRWPDSAPLPDGQINSGQVPYILVDLVKYNDKAPWPVAADGTGLSLQRVSPTGYANDPTNWLAGAPSPGLSDSQDHDGDGIPDSWEIANGLNPDDAADASLD